MTLSGWADTQWGSDVITWDELWLNVAELVSRRSRCVRDRVGAVIVSSDNVMLSVGYNGPPTGLPVDGPCSNWCPRAQLRGETPCADYSDCFSIHAETNCILRLPGKPIDHRGGTLYVNSTICWPCANMVATAGLSRVVMNVKAGALRRSPEDVIALLEDCGTEVVLGSDWMSKYRRIFLDQHGLGPHRCTFCDVVMPTVEVIHHLDGDHTNNAVENLAPAHARCHLAHHSRGRKHSRASIERTHGVRVTCPTCGMESTRAGMGRHRSARGH